MKKHPVDDLFSRKLRDAEVTPREEAYQKFEQRLQTKQRRLGGWWQQGPWLAAAGVCLLLVAGWVVWESNPSEDTLIAQETIKAKSVVEQNVNQVAKTKPLEEQTRINEEGSPQSIAVNQLPQVATAERVPLILESKKDEQSLSRQENQVAQVVQTPKVPIIKSPEQIIPQEEPKAIALNTATVVETKSTETTVVLHLPELRETLAAVNDKGGVMSLTESTNSKVEESILNQPRKSSRMGKVWKQLKNAKNGERVDWDEVGFNPNKLLAKATGKDL